MGGQKERTSAKISPKKQTSNVMKHPMWQEKCVRLLNSALHLLSLKMLSLSVNALFLWGRLMSMAVVFWYGNEPRDRFFLLSIIILIINFCYYFVQRNTNYCFTSAIILKFAFILPSKKIEFALLLLQYISDICNSDVGRLLEGSQFLSLVIHSTY